MFFSSLWQDSPTYMDYLPLHIMVAFDYYFSPKHIRLIGREVFANVPSAELRYCALAEKLDATASGTGIVQLLPSFLSVLPYVCGAAVGGPHTHVRQSKAPEGLPSTERQAQRLLQP